MRRQFHRIYLPSSPIRSQRVRSAQLLSWQRRTWQPHIQRVGKTRASFLTIMILATGQRKQLSSVALDGLGTLGGQRGGLELRHGRCDCMGAAGAGGHCFTVSKTGGICRKMSQLDTVTNVPPPDLAVYSGQTFRFAAFASPKLPRSWLNWSG